MRSRILQWWGVLCLTALMARAEPCVVTSSSGGEDAGALAVLVRGVLNDGACAADAGTVREQYGDILGMAQQVHIIRWNYSMDIRLNAALPGLQARGAAPVILQAAPGTVVRIRGTTPIRLSGDGPVILDGVTLEQFPDAALIVSGNRHVVRNVRILHSGRAGKDPAGAAVQISGSHNRFDALEVAHSRGVGVWIDERTPIGCAATGQHTATDNRLAHSDIHDNGATGLWMHGSRAQLTDSRVAANAGDGIVLENPAAEFTACHPQSMKDPTAAIHAMLIEGTTFGANDGAAIAYRGQPMPRPVDLIGVSPLSARDMVIVGNIGAPEDAASLWNAIPLDLSQLRVELFVSDAADPAEGVVSLGFAGAVDTTTRQFIGRIPYPITVQGRPLEQPYITALVTDREHGVTSAFAEALDVVARTDWDADGLANADEDLNADGEVGVSETDPRIPDSDGDLVADGEEITRGLQGRSADTDGDCLPDGLEMGRTAATAMPWTPVPGSMLQRPRVQWTPGCLARLNAHKVEVLEHAIPWNPVKPAAPNNIAALQDADPTTTTDPLQTDSDRDGVSDGDEDWNWDGRRTTAEPAAADAGQALLLGAAAPPLETDATVADSDGDGLLDGEEGDRNRNGTLEANETDALLSDTDGDGLPDGDEVRRHGTDPNRCDTDGDGLGDGLEAGRMNPAATTAQCRGLQSAGSNYASTGAMQPLQRDSDSDGLDDGAEDANANGWLDPNETDPSSADTDRDGIDDYIEQRGDLDHDGVADWLPSHINNGKSCAPPERMDDLDCDGVPNARDDDADNDGCLDRDEGLDARGDRHGIPAVYQSTSKQCGASKSGGSSSGGSSPSVGAPAVPADDVDPAREYYAQRITGGGSCSLVIP